MDVQLHLRRHNTYNPVTNNGEGCTYKLAKYY